LFPHSIQYPAPARLSARLAIKIPALPRTFTTPAPDPLPSVTAALSLGLVVGEDSGVCWEAVTTKVDVDGSAGVSVVVTSVVEVISLGEVVESSVVESVVVVLSAEVVVGKVVDDTLVALVVEVVAVVELGDAGAVVFST
jgi:hypothetical protein